jgi:glucosamine 6-phosphate synthetase-like amidotransferase/phosphosugar isomerase protein
MSERRNKHPFHIYETIMGAPEKLQEWLGDNSRAKIRSVAEEIRRLKPKKIFIAGTGGSYMAAMAESFAFNEIVGIPSSFFVTAELRAYPPLDFCAGNLLIINTHSGKSPGDVAMAELARERGVFTIGVTDIDGTPFTKSVDALLIGRDGPKFEMPATRTYSSAIFRTTLLAVECAKKQASLYRAREFERQLKLIPEMMRSHLDDLDKKASGVVDSIHGSSAYFIISAGTNMSTAIDGAMGMTQGTGMPTAGYHVDEYLHGPIQSLKKGRCVVTIASPGPFHEKLWRFAEVAKNIGAKVLMIAPEGSDAVGHGDVSVTLPSGIDELLTPPLYSAPFWLIGYYASLKNGLDPDTLSMELQEFKSSGLADMKKYF